MLNVDTPSVEQLWESTAETLVAMGAPLAGFRPQLHGSLESALARSLEFSRTNATLLRVLPIVLARWWRRLDWARLEQEARELGALETLGMLTELTASLANAPELAERARVWWRPVSEATFFFAPRNVFDEELARARTPLLARRWGYLMNMGDDSFRSLFERHAG